MPLDPGVEEVTIFIDSKPKGMRTLIYPAALIRHKTLGACWHPISYHDIVSSQEGDDQARGGDSKFRFTVMDISKLGGLTNGLHGFPDILISSGGI